MSTEIKYLKDYWFGATENTVIADTVLFMERDRIEQYKGAMDLVTHHFQGVFRGITGNYRGRQITVIYSIGPAHIADCINFLAHCFPLKRCFATGSIGGLTTEIGDIIISNSCTTQDGYGCNLFREEVSSNDALGFHLELTSKISPDSLKAETRRWIETEFDCRVRNGTLFTTAAVSLESTETLNAIKDCGFTAIDLESGPFLAACRNNRIDGLCIHWVTDLPLTRDFYYQYYGDRQTVEADKAKKHKQWLNMPKIILPILYDFLP